MPIKSGIRIRSTTGEIYVMYLTIQLEPCSFLKNFENFVVGFSGGL